MQEFTCPTCETVVGSALEGSQPTFYHCGIRFPRRDEFIPDFKSIYLDGKLTLAEREQNIGTQVRHLENRVRRLSHTSAMPLHQARGYLKDLRDSRSAAACITDPSKTRVTKDRGALVKAWRFMLMIDANNRGVSPPGVGIDACREYAAQYDLAASEPGYKNS